MRAPLARGEGPGSLTLLSTSNIEPGSASSDSTRKVARCPIESIAKPASIGPMKPEMEKHSESLLKFAVSSEGWPMWPVVFCTLIM